MSDNFILRTWYLSPPMLVQEMSNEEYIDSDIFPVNELDTLLDEKIESVLENLNWLQETTNNIYVDDNVVNYIEDEILSLNIDHPAVEIIVNDFHIFVGLINDPEILYDMESDIDNISDQEFDDLVPNN